MITITDFSLEKLKKDTEKDTCSGFKETKISSIILCLDLLKPFSDKKNLIEFIARRCALQEILMDEEK